MANILLVEDDKGLGYILKEYLEVHDYEVSWTQNGIEAWKQYLSSHFDLCLLDVMLPKMDGFSLAKKIRLDNSKIPIIFLTAKGLKVDKLKGFKIGCDDYIVKPVDEEELIMRIEAILKRIRYSQNDWNTKGTYYRLGDFDFDPSRQLLTLNDEKQNLTIKETAILKLLCQHQGRILDRKETLKKIWGESDYFKRRSMDVFISRIRNYLKKDPRIKITNIHSKGYMLTIEQ